MAVQLARQTSSSYSIFNRINNLQPTCIFTQFLRLFSSTKVLNRTFFEPYKRPLRYQSKEKPLLYHAKKGSKKFWPELTKFWNETKETFINDYEEVKPGDYKIFWNFNNEEEVKKWHVIADSDHGEGYSTCSFVYNKNKNAVFSGVLNSKPLKDGVIKRSGYCVIKLPTFTKSFKRLSYLDWSAYTHLIMRVRGDGRMYTLNVYTEGEFDVSWHDAHFFPLYTRGGPHWQNVKVPLAKFVFGSKGMVQDEQNEIPCDNISSFGITMSDRIYGPFNLEIESIGVYYDPSFEQCDGDQTDHYDLYTVPRSAPG